MSSNTNRNWSYESSGTNDPHRHQPQPTHLLMFRQGDILFRQIPNIPKDVIQKLHDNKMVVDPLSEVAYGEVSGHKHQFQAMLLQVPRTEEAVEQVSTLTREEMREKAMEINIQNPSHIQVLKNPGINETAQYIIIDPHTVTGTGKGQQTAELEHNEHKTIDMTGQQLEKLENPLDQPMFFEVVREQDYNPFRDMVQTVKD